MNSCSDTKEFILIKEFKVYLTKKFMNSTKKEINSSKKYKEFVKDLSLHRKFLKISELSLL